MNAKERKARARKAGKISGEKRRILRESRERGVQERFKIKPRSGLTRTQSLPRSLPKKPKLGAITPHKNIGYFTEIASKYFEVDKELPNAVLADDISAEQVDPVKDVINPALEFYHQFEPYVSWVSVMFEFIRYIPFNPAYKGEMVKKQGQWLPEYPMSTAFETTDEGLTMQIYNKLNLKSAANQTRHIWLTSFRVSIKNQISWRDRKPPYKKPRRKKRKKRPIFIPKKKPLKPPIKKGPKHVPKKRKVSPKKRGKSRPKKEAT